MKHIHWQNETKKSSALKRATLHYKNDVSLNKNVCGSLFLHWSNTIFLLENIIVSIKLFIRLIKFF